MGLLDKVRISSRVKTVTSKVAELEALIFEICPPDVNRQEALNLLRSCSALASQSIKVPKFS